MAPEQRNGNGEEVRAAFRAIAAEFPQLEGGIPA
jgi:hypothetical protein